MIEQLSFFPLSSPCVGVCQSDNRGYCKGCFRSRDERFYWQSFSENQKLNVIRLCKARQRRKQLALAKAKKQQALAQQQQTNQSFDFDDSNKN